MSKHFNINDVDFTNDDKDGIISSLPFLSEEESMSRYHLGNSIYLYAVFSEGDFENMYNTGTIKTPIVLYESINIAKKMADKNIQQPVCLKFVVDVEISSQKLGIDYLIPEYTPSRKDEKLYLSKAGYIRKYDKDKNIITYTINDSHRLLQPYRAE